MNLNIRSLFLLSQQIAKHSMIPNKYGRIINLASIAGLFGSSGDMQMIAYNTSKGAVVNFTRALAGSWGRYGITANALAPGFFPSRMTKGTIEAVGVEKLAAGAPLRRIGDEDDLKGAAVLFQRRGQAHHRSDPCRRWRSDFGDIGLGNHQRQRLGSQGRRLAVLDLKYRAISFPAVAQTVGFGLGRSKMLDLSMGID